MVQKHIIRDTRLSLRTWNFAYTNEQANFQNGLSIFEPKLSVYMSLLDIHEMTRLSYLYNVISGNDMY